MKGISVDSSFDSYTRGYSRSKTDRDEQTFYIT